MSLFSCEVDNSRLNGLEMASKAAKFGSHGGFSYAVKVDGIDNEFFKLSFGQQLDHQKKANFLKSHPEIKVEHVGAKGKATLAAVKQWVKEAKPTQFFAKWQSDSDYYKDDVVQVYFLA